MKTASLIQLAALSLMALCLYSGTSLAGEKQKPDNPAKPRQLSDKEKRILAKAEKRLYARFKNDGGISDPSFPFIAYVKRVEGTMLIGVEFMRRDPSGNGFDLVGRAESMEVRIDAAQQKILVEFHNVEGFQSYGAKWYIESKIWPLDLPSDLSVFSRTSGMLRKEDLGLSAEQRKFLAEGFPKEAGPSKVDSKLKKTD